VLSLLVLAGCGVGDGQEASMNSDEADARIRTLIAETAQAVVGDREVTLQETSRTACDAGVPPEEVHLSISGRVQLRDGEGARSLLPAAERFFEERDLEVEVRETIARTVIGRTDDGLLVDLTAAEGDQQLSLGGGSQCVENVEPDPAVPPPSSEGSPSPTP